MKYNFMKNTIHIEKGIKWGWCLNHAAWCIVPDSQ